MNISNLCLFLNKVSSIVFLMVIGVCILVSELKAQEYSEGEVKTALLVHIIKNIEWPEDKNKEAIRFSIWQNRQAYQSLVLLNNIDVRNKPIRLSLAINEQQLADADIIYISQQYLDDLSTIALQLRGSGKLIITEQSQTLHNGMVNLVVDNKQKGQARLKFQINRPNLVFEGFTLLPELVLFGGTEVDVAQLYHQTEQGIRELRSLNEQAFAKLSQQQREIDEKEQEFISLQKQVSKLNQQLSERQKDLTESKLDLEQLQNKAINAEQQYKQALQQMTDKEAELKEAVAELSVYEVNVSTQQQLLSRLEKEVTANQILLKEQGSLLTAAESEVKHQSELISQQREIIIFVLIVAVIIILASLTITILFLKNKRIKDQLQLALTNLTEAQEQLVEAEKMASLGQLVTGVAHEVNTPIGIALTAISTLGEETKKFRVLLEEGKLKKSTALEFTDRLTELDKLVQGNLQRCHRLVENFKQVSADQVVAESRTIAIKDYCHKIFETLSVYLKRNNVAWAIDGDNPEIDVDPGILSQVLSNLATNAVTHAFTDNSNAEITLAINKSAEVIAISFFDNGIGMDKETQQKLFDPFFTTKRGKGGTGLGMNIVYNLVTAKLKGNIIVESEVGEGTRFVITLPSKGL